MVNEVTRSFLHGALTGLNAYFKPGSLHRLKPLRIFDEASCNIVSSIHVIDEAFSIGERVRKGELSFASVELGKLAGRLMRESYRFCGNCHPSYTIPLLVLSIAIGHSNVVSVSSDTSKFKRSLDLVLSINKWGEVKAMIDAFKTVGRADLYEHLSSTGVDQITIVQSGVSFSEVFKTLGSKQPAFTLLDSRETLVFNYLKKIAEYYRKARDLNNALVAIYLDIAEPFMTSDAKRIIDEARSLGLMTSKEGARKLYEADLLLGKQGVSLNHYADIVSVLGALAVFEGFT
ncbi:MAG: hypothetical protein QXW58_00940 [Thermosphaera sp.]